MSRCYGVALWLRFDSPGAEYVDEVADWEIDNLLEACNKWAYGDYILGAVLAAMYRCGVPAVSAACVSVNHEGTPQWRYRIDLPTAPVRIRIGQGGNW